MRSSRDSNTYVRAAAYLRYSKVALSIESGDPPSWVARLLDGELPPGD